MSDKKVNKRLFGQRIKEKREKLKYTQFELAEKAGISQNFLGDIERGIKLPSIDTLLRLANTLKISLDSLFADSLDNLDISDSEAPYFTGRQLSILNGVIKTINENFKDNKIIY